MCVFSWFWCVGFGKRGLDGSDTGDGMRETEGCLKGSEGTMVMGVRCGKRRVVEIERGILVGGALGWCEGLNIAALR